MRREIRAFTVLAPAASLAVLPAAFGGDVSGTVQAKRVLGLFPPKSQISPNRTAWRLSAILEWMNAREAA